MKILNLYAGVGGNRKLWDNCEVTAVEYNEDIARVYQKLYPSDILVVGDAHQYLIENIDKYDFIWSSPPCQTHSRMVKATRHKIRKYPDLKLYEEILLLSHHFKGKFIVENVVPYYEPLVAPYKRIGRHLFWSNFEFEVSDVKRPPNFINSTNMAGRKALQDWLGIHFDEVIYYDGNHCPAQILRNSVHPTIGKGILDAARASQWG